MHNLKLTLICILLQFTFFAQKSFYTTYSDKGYDVGEGIVQLKDSGYLITGSSGSFTGSSQAFILKTDKYGTREWSKNYGGLESEKGRRIFHIENDGIYVIGQTNSVSGKFFDAYFFKTDLSGDLLFEKNYGGEGYDAIYDAILLKDTSFILVGETPIASNEIENIYLLRINKYGDTLWTKNFGTDQKDVARSIKQLNDSTVIVVGEYYVADSLTQKALIMSLDINGTINWMKTYGKKGKFVLNDVSISKDAITAVGYNHIDLSIPQNNSIFRMYTDLNGENERLETDYNDGNFTVENITQFGDNPNDYYYGINIENTTSVKTYPNGMDLYVYFFGSDLYFLGTAFAPSNIGNDRTNQLIKTLDGGAILVGSNETPNNGGSNVLLVKIGPNLDFKYSHTIPSQQTLVAINEITPNSLFNITPNPCTNELFIQNLANEKLVKIKVLSLHGDVIFEKLNPESDKLNLSNLTNGIYFISINEKTYKLIKN